jgi:drug/metabolite transporter (DMT)-like permease
MRRELIPRRILVLIAGGIGVGLVIIVAPVSNPKFPFWSMVILTPLLIAGSVYLWKTADKKDLDPRGESLLIGFFAIFLIFEYLTALPYFTFHQKLSDYIAVVFGLSFGISSLAYAAYYKRMKEKLENKAVSIKSL